MKNRMVHVKGLALMLTTAFVLGGCAAAVIPEQEPTVSNADDEIGDIVLTGSASGGREQSEEVTVEGSRERNETLSSNAPVATDEEMTMEELLRMIEEVQARNDQEARQREAEFTTQRNQMQNLMPPGQSAPESPAIAGGALANTWRPANISGEPPPVFVDANEEIWVIARYDDADGAATQEDEVGTGSLIGYLPQPDEPDVRVPMPLTHTAVTADIDGYISSVNVRQTFENPFSEKIEAVYMFPLPEKSAVSEFLMIIGERRIRGILREKEEAEEIYAEARAQGYQASLLVQHRPNVFEQRVANIEPGNQIDIDIRYFHTLAYEDGWYSFVFPTVVGPRFNPPGSVDPIEAVGRGQQTSHTAVTYLRPDERSGHDISISLEIDAGVEIDDLRSTHQIVSSTTRPDTVQVSLASEATIPNRDFILEFRVAGDQIRSNLLTHRDAQTGEGYFTMMLYPPEAPDNLPRRPMEMVFVLDCSGSMDGRPLAQAKDAVSAALSHLEPQDTFQIIRFSSNASRLGTTPLPATPSNIAMARQYLNSLNSSGGTMMIEGIKAALDFPHDPVRLRFVSFMTDGYIGNENEILAAVHERIGESRIFSFGVGSSVNRFLLERMAQAGRGAVAWLGPQDSGGEIMSSFFTRISQPAMTDVEIDWGGMRVSDIYPSRLQDLFVGRPVVLTGKFDGPLSPITVSGLAGGETQQIVVRPSADDTNPNLGRIWARLRIADLANRQNWQQDPYGELETAILQTALRHQLVSNYTAFVAVDASQTTAGDHGVTIQQAVPVPDGVRYETTVQEQE